MTKLKLTIAFIILIAISFNKIYSQSPTLGLQHLENSVSDGYTLFTPESNTSVYLIDNCGEKVNEWTFSELPGATCYLLENGNLLRAGKQSIEIRDWDNNIIWTFLMSNIGLNQHHDIEPLPNGNILCLVKDIYTKSEMIEMGRDPSRLDSIFKLDKLIELEPINYDEANIVWKWKFADHFIQEFDDTKANYGSVSNHPELIDINFDNSEITDFTHVNGIDYNKKLDQIILSARHLNEIYIIDHSTSSEEAASHSGGNSGKGGDLLWRWGNPQVYQQGIDVDQKLFLQHDSKWVEENYLDEGKITVFNNYGDASLSFSAVHLITTNEVNGLYPMYEGKFLPEDFEWSWSGSILNETVLEVKKSGTHSLPNGNFIICETARGRISEINKAGELLWVYTNPSGELVHDQFETIDDNKLFRAEKYPVNFIGFQSKDLSPKGIIENENSITALCNETVYSQKLKNLSLQIVNPIENGKIIFNKSIEAESIIIYDINGYSIMQTSNFNNSNLNLSLKKGLYIMTIQTKKETDRYKLIYK